MDGELVVEAGWILGFPSSKTLHGLVCTHGDDSVQEGEVVSGEPVVLGRVSSAFGHPDSALVPQYEEMLLRIASCSEISIISLYLLCD